MLDIAKGLHYLHRNSILHRDVKPENLMIDNLVINFQKICSTINVSLSCFGLFQLWDYIAACTE